jgi:hypothetical protein
VTERSDEDIRRVLKQAVPPVSAELRHDLWPAMRRRLAEGETKHRGVVLAVHLPWYDWALAGAVLAAVAFSPQLILVIVYHL